MMLQERSIGNKIAEARKKQNLSQAELGRLISISPQAVGKWERGESLPDITTLDRLAEILGVDLNYFSENYQPKPTNESPEHKQEVKTDERPKFGIKKRLNWNMSSGNWSDADFSGLKNLKDKFSSSNMKNCKFTNADLSGLILASNNIEKCDFSNTDLRDCKVRSSNLLEDKFIGASLIDAQFTRNNISKCDFTGADLAGAEFTACCIEHASVEQANWKFTTFKNSDIGDVTFTGTMEDCHFENCSFYRVTFREATLLNSFFKYNRRFKKVQFVNCKVDSITYAFLKNNQADLSSVTMI